MIEEEVDPHRIPDREEAREADPVAGARSVPHQALERQRPPAARSDAETDADRVPLAHHFPAEA